MFDKDKETGEFVYTEEYCINDIITGKEKLEKIFGTEVVGLAWPYTIPIARPNIRKHAKENYIYVRGSGDNYSFDVPEKFMDEWTFTVYQARSKGVLKEYAEKYQTYDSKKLSLFSVWGHSFEFFNGALSFDEYDEFLEICRTIDLWNPTCADYVRYVNAHKEMIVDYENVYNPSEFTQYIKANGEEIVLPAGARYDGETVFCNKALNTQNGIEVAVNLDARKATGEKAALLTAVYDKNGKLISCRTSEIAGGILQTAQTVLPATSQAASVKVFLFNDFSSFAPLDSAKIIPVTVE